MHSYTVCSSCLLIISFIIDDDFVSALQLLYLYSKDAITYNNNNNI